MKVPCYLTAKAVHLLVGGSPGRVKLHYAGGVSETVEWQPADEAGTKFDMELPGGHKPRYGSLRPTRAGVIQQIEFETSVDAAPIVLAVTVETK